LSVSFHKTMKWVCVAATFCLAVQIAWAEDSGPSYQGHTFSEWASQIDFTAPVMGEGPPAYAAIHHIGTNAIPILLSWISNQKAPKAMPDQVYKPPLWFSPTRVEAAAMLFCLLDSEARPAIPELTRYAMTFPDYERYDQCVRALAGIGQDSLPAFNTLLTKGRPEVQFSALEWLPGFGTNAIAVMPAVINCLVGKNDEVADKSVDFFFQDSAVRGSVVTSALTNAMTHASAKGRMRICRCFFFMSYNKPPAEQPWAAVPVLRAALKDPNPEVSNTASNALVSIETSKQP
jgi:hypothetical protein